MARLGGGVNDRGGVEFFDEFEDRGAIPNIELVMTEGGEGLSEAMLVPAGVSAWAKEVGSLIVVDAVDLLATGGKEGNHFGSDEAGGAGDEELHAWYLCGRWGRGGKERVFGLPKARSLWGGR